MHVSAATLAPDWSVRKATPTDNTERTALSGAVDETIYLSRPRHAQCNNIGLWLYIAIHFQLAYILGMEHTAKQKIISLTTHHNNITT